MESLQPDDPRQVGAYRLLARLGAGGMGSVFLGRSASGRTVAVKFIHADLARDREFRERFRNEVETARRVSGPWTAPVLDADTESAAPWVATGYVAGPTLQDTVTDLYGPLPEDSVRTLATGLAEALREIHDRDLIHRDLKPSNVLLTLDGPRVIDFGISRATDGTAITRTGMVVGTPGFMPPEQVRGERVTPAGDVFSLGAVIAYAATGRQPFDTGAGASVPSLLFRVVSEPPELGDMAGPLRDLAERCLAKDPAERPAPAEIVESLGGPAPGPWLPAELLDRLGRHAAELLDLEHVPEQDDPGRPQTKPYTAVAGTPPPPPPPPPPRGNPGAPGPVGAQGNISPSVQGYGFQWGAAPPPPPGHRPAAQPPPPPGHRPAAARPRRSAATLPLVAAVAALSVILIGVLAMVAFRPNGDDRASADGDDSRNPATAPGKSSSPSSPKGDGDDGDSGTGSAEKGPIPAAFIGTWVGEVGNQTRRMVIKQGPAGSDIVSTRTTSSRGYCEGKGKLVSAASNVLEVTTRLTKSVPSDLCASVGKQTLTLRDNGTAVRYKGGFLSSGTLYKR